MKQVWIVEKYMHLEYEDGLVAAIEKSGANCYLFDDTHYTFDFDKSIKNKFTEKDCTVFYGSFQRGRQIYSQTNFIPGIFITVENYECYKYYGYYGYNLLNHNYLMFGLNDIQRNIVKIFDYFKTDSIFIRPSNGYKTFTGQLLSKENFEEEFRVLCLSYGGLDLDQLVVVSPKQDIIEENRFLVVNKNNRNYIVDGVKYMVNKEVLTEREVDENAWIYAETVVDYYTPDKAFTIDIAKLADGSYKVLEIGTFCCAGLYCMDLDKVVESINELCILEYNDYWNIK